MHGIHAQTLLQRSHLWGRAIISLVVLFVLSTNMRPVHALPVGGIVNLKPQVQVHAEKQKGWTVAGERFALGYGDCIRTDKGGKADVLFNNGTEIIMRSNTQIQIVAPASADKPLVVRVFGALSEIFVRAKGNTEIRTEASNAAVRGTEFLIRLPAPDCTTLTVITGVVDFSNAKGLVTVRAAQQSTARVGERPSPPTTVDVTGLIAWTA
ncbi:MAG TPA: FecR family protein, partial [Armatimonadota bacterium]